MLLLFGHQHNLQVTGFEGYGLGSIQQLNGQGWKPVANTKSLLPQTVSTTINAQIPNLNVHLNDKEYGFLIYTNQESITNTSSDLALTYFNGNTNTWQTPYTLSTIKSLPLKDLNFISLFAPNPNDNDQYSLGIIYTGSPYGTEGYKTSIFGAAAHGSELPFSNARRVSSASKSAPADETIPIGTCSLVNSVFQSYYAKTITWIMPDNIKESASSVAIIRSQTDFSNDKFGDVNVNSDNRFIATNLPLTTTEYTDPNRPTTTEYYAAAYINPDGTLQRRTKVAPVSCTTNQNTN